MLQVPDTTSRYSAFISYSHADTSFARRLQRRLETYRLPRHLSAQGAVRPRSSRLLPVFRDRDELAASADLTQSVRTALAEAAYMIVVCSPAAAASAWVSREVALFRDMRGPERILCALHLGGPEDSFPSVLLGDGAEETRAAPLAADFRRTGDGDRLALLKLVAVLAQVRLDELIQRDAHRRVRLISALAAASLCGMAIMGVLTLAAVRARNAAEQERLRSEDLVDFMLKDLRTRLQGVGQLGLLDAVNKGALRYFASQDLEHAPASELERRAALLQAIGQDDETRGDLSGAQVEFKVAERITAALLNEKPNDPKRIFAQAQSEYWTGYIAWRQDDSDGALAGYRNYLRLTQQLMRIAPANMNYRLERGEASSDLAAVILRKSVDTADAMPLFEAALEDFKQAADAYPEDKGIQGVLISAYGWLADCNRLKDAYPAASDNRTEQLKIITKLLQTDDHNFAMRLELVRNALGRARIAAATGDLTRAIAILQSGRDMALQLQREDTHRADVATQARVIELFEVRVWLSIRPSTPQLQRSAAGALADCKSEASKPKSDELAAFCDIQRARLLALQGDPEGAARFLSPLKLTANRSFRLTDHNLFDLQKEAKMN